MQISRYSDYAVRVLMFAALKQPALVTIDEVADSFAISRHHLVKVVHALGQAGFLATRRGAGGGFRLALPPEKIMLGPVIRLTETTNTVVNCQDRPGVACRILPACRLKRAFAEAGEAFFAVLDRCSLASLVRPKSELKGLLSL
jgi:Rrf2 family nitric oxide-sensitive transcriptional repressor